MSDWPPVRPLEAYAGGVISTATVLGSGYNVTAPASAAWPSANLAIFVPFRLASSVIVYKMATGAGSTAAGNFDVGIYDSAGNRLVSSGTTAKGNSAEHILNVTDTVIGPGLYYLAMAADGTNNYIMITPSGTSPVPLQKTRLYGVVAAASSFVLPTTVTFAASTFAPIPMIAAYLRAA